MSSVAKALTLYHVARKWFTVSVVTGAPASFIVDAPFGRFSPKESSIFLLDGRIAWIIMELPSPAFFIYTFLKSPLSPAPPSLSSFNLTQPYTILAMLYVLHYLNRAIISPLRTPSRSKSHIMVPLFAISWNVVNGSLMGSYLSSPFARNYLSDFKPSFFIGLAVFFLSLVMNIYHDEILLNIRRKSNSKGKGKAKANGNGQAGEHYAIPHGGLYSLISYPNYLFEWTEWLGFAIAAAPVPLVLSDLTLSSISATLLDVQTYINFINTPAQQWGTSFTPPWLFFINSVIVMFPRAYKGHKWYLDKFGDAYPKRRKAVIPFVI